MARLPINPDGVGEPGLPVSAPEGIGIAVAGHLAAVPFENERKHRAGAVANRENAVRTTRVLDAVDHDGKRELAGVADRGRHVRNEVAVIDEVEPACPAIRKKADDEVRDADRVINVR